MDAAKIIEILSILQKEMWTQKSECEDCSGSCDWCVRYNALEEAKRIIGGINNEN